MILKEMIDHISSLAKEMHLLYVEDEELVLKSTKLLLETIFPQVETASNGIEALKLYQNKKFDLVITDIFMPEMNGIVLVNKIKELNPGQPIIITSACEESSYLLELINLGVAQFLLKPIQLEQVINVMREVVTNIHNQQKADELNSNLKQELLHQTTLLKQYKEVVDISSIVTQTNIDGDIIYANEAFCKTTGYSFDEIISKNHNLVRHPDISHEFYKNLWETILNKQTWNGIIKNLDKNGKSYINNSTIKPILDEFNNIINVISISHNVTELFELNDEIWHTQHEMLSLLGEVGETRSQETGNHVRRVAEYAKLLGKLYGLEEEQIKLLYSASPMHDIGKIGIPDAILLKPDN